MDKKTRGKRRVMVWMALIFGSVLMLLAWWMNQPAPQTTVSGPISAISIESAGQTPIRFRYADKRWLMTEPVTARPNQARLQLLLNLRHRIAADARPFQASSVEGGKLPATSVTIRMDDETYAFGALTADRRYRHVRFRDTDYLVPDPWFRDTEVEMDEFLDRRLLPEGSRIDAIQLPDVSLHKLPSGAWGSARPVEASTGALAALVMNWQLAYATSVHAGAEDTAGKQKASIHLHGDAGERWHPFFILQRAPTLTLYDPEARIRYSFPADIAAGLLNLQALDAEGAIDPEPRLQ